MCAREDGTIAHHHVPRPRGAPHGRRLLGVAAGALLLVLAAACSGNGSAPSKAPAPARDRDGDSRVTHVLPDGDGDDRRLGHGDRHGGPARRPPA